MVFGADDVASLATADFLSTDICVYKYSTSALTTPVVYSSKSTLSMSHSLSICLYKPVYYKAVIDIKLARNLNV